MATDFIGLSTERSFDDIRQVAQCTVREVVRVGRLAHAEVVHGGQWTQPARGVAGRANVSLCFAFSFEYFC